MLQRILSRSAYHPFPSSFRLACRSFSGITGVQFTPLDPVDLKIREWTKNQQLKKRKEELQKKGEEIWRVNKQVSWSSLNEKDIYALWKKQFNETPSEWETRELFALTLQKYAPWKYEEIEQRRLKEVDEAVEEIFQQIRGELERASIDKPVEISKNDLATRLIKKLKTPPNKREVERMWGDRYKLPRVKWLGDID